MPDKLKLFLETLTDEEADAMWLYLDGDPRAAGDMIELIIESHPNLQAGGINGATTT